MNSESGSNCNSTSKMIDSLPYAGGHPMIDQSQHSFQVESKRTQTNTRFFHFFSHVSLNISALAEYFHIWSSQNTNVQLV